MITISLQTLLKYVLPGTLLDSQFNLPWPITNYNTFSWSLLVWYFKFWYLFWNKLLFNYIPVIYHSKVWILHWFMQMFFSLIWWVGMLNLVDTFQYWFNNWHVLVVVRWSQQGYENRNMKQKFNENSAASLLIIIKLFQKS